MKRKDLVLWWKLFFEEIKIPWENGIKIVINGDEYILDAWIPYWNRLIRIDEINNVNKNIHYVNEYTHPILQIIGKPIKNGYKIIIHDRQAYFDYVALNNRNYPPPVSLEEVRKNNKVVGYQRTSEHLIFATCRKCPRIYIGSDDGGWESLGHPEEGEGGCNCDYWPYSGDDLWNKEFRYAAHRFALLKKINKIENEYLNICPMFGKEEECDECDKCSLFNECQETIVGISNLSKLKLNEKNIMDYLDRIDKKKKRKKSINNKIKTLEDLMEPKSSKIHTSIDHCDEPKYTLRQLRGAWGAGKNSK